MILDEDTMVYYINVYGKLFLDIWEIIQDISEFFQDIWEIIQDNWELFLNIM